MPTKIEKDTATGRMTTGHEWDGIKELNTPLPKWWLYVFYACIAFSAVWVVLYPGIPLGTTYFKGLLGYSTRVEHAQNLAAVQTVDEINLSLAAPQQVLFTVACRLYYLLIC